MGLWQLAQASTVLNCTVQSVYPQVGDDIMRRDFHRTFFPIGSEEFDERPLLIMWTGSKGCTPDHFVPLLWTDFETYVFPQVH